jgi:hypothetical protein
MLVLPSAPAEDCAIQARYFASDRNRAPARTKVQALVFEDFGAARQRVTEKTILLEYDRELHDLLVVTRGAATKAVAR